jgi:hypothetical protein
MHDDGRQRFEDEILDDGWFKDEWFDDKWLGGGWFEDR